MVSDGRLEQIVGLVEERGFISVKELSGLLDVSEVTIRRDLQQLDKERRLKKTYGGAISLHNRALPVEAAAPPPSPALPEGSLLERVDVLIASSLDPQSDRALMDRAEMRTIPVVAESIGARGMKSVVCVDNYRAAFALGCWAGDYVRRHFDGKANVLDLTYRLSNTQARSEGFLAGLRENVPDAQVVLSINAQSRFQTAHQLTADALNVHPNINVIFAINDSTAWGAVRACQALGLNPDSLLVLTFGLEGDTLKNALMDAGYCKAGLAMFPEIVAPVCIEAAIEAYNNRLTADNLVTPHAVLTPATLTDYYARSEKGWQYRWDTLQSRFSLPYDISGRASRAGMTLPGRIGFVVPFGEHEWYKNLSALMHGYADCLGIGFEAVDAAQTIKDDLYLRQRAIAQMAAEQVQPGDVVLIDGSEITTYLAEELASKENLTVITNSVSVFLALRNRPGITLISTGGSLRRSSDSLIGPTAEAALTGLRADKLFLAVTGISLGFGLSHTNVAEVAVKQAMMRAAREVILLADHSKFGLESVIQMAPATVVNTLVTDNALPASTRLELSKLGIQVILAKT
jgi:DeoR/GlpR family transcriptional regulator of sugar metabolism/ABC-type sugar transport system substrate-binding protein